MAFLFDLFSLAASGGAVWMYYQCYTGAHHQADSLISLGLGVAAAFFAFQGFYRRIEKVEMGLEDWEPRDKRHKSAFAVLVVLFLIGLGNCL